MPESAGGTALAARTTSTRIDHIYIVVQRNVGAGVAELDVKGFGTDGKTAASPSTWQAVLENGRRIHLPPCATAAAAAPILNRTQNMIAATEAVITAVDNKKITSFADAHVALFKAQRDVLRAEGEAK